MTTHMHPLRAAVIMRNNESHWNGLTSTVVSSSVTSSLTNNVIIMDIIKNLIMVATLCDKSGNLEQLHELKLSS